MKNGSASCVGKSLTDIVDITRIGRVQLLEQKAMNNRAKQALYYNFVQEDVPHNIITLIQELLDASEGEFSVGLDDHELYFLLNELCVN